MGSTAWLQCNVAAEIPGGDHTLLLGAVRGCSTTDRTPPGVQPAQLRHAHRAALDHCNRIVNEKGRATGPAGPATGHREGQGQ
ncbi:flavin reductase family protein [Rhodococcus sp. NPDC059968]|uniref:flavin reductase family protein n=1 Tax=Rhodococcus sp. NPDC059968 TaxID=3347017 RepID=UPI003671B29F